MTNKIDTLEKFAEKINAEDWSLEYTKIMAENGWKDNSAEPYGICESETQKLILNDAGIAVVIDK